MTARESAEAKRQREERERAHHEHYVWMCKGCGPCETSRGSWCDKGCGSDHPGMIEMPRNLLARIEAAAVERGALLGRGAKEIDHLALDSMSKHLADARALLKEAIFAGATLNETLNPLLDWEPRDKANRRKRWQAVEDEMGRFLRRGSESEATK